jgi:hypothetical protein
MSDGDVSCCTAPATQNASFQVLKRPTPAIVFETATNSHVLLPFGKVQNPLRLPQKMAIERSKVHCAQFLNQKRSDPEMFLAF